LSGFERTLFAFARNAAETKLPDGVRARLNFCEAMAEDVAPDGALIVFVIFSTEISPLTRLANPPQDSQRQASSAVGAAYL
jgi:hypothetical protein